jgi:hypothetical protein
MVIFHIENSYAFSKKLQWLSYFYEKYEKRKKDTKLTSTNQGAE